MEPPPVTDARPGTAVVPDPVAPDRAPERADHSVISAVVVYPDAVWYGFVKPEDAAEIVTEHLVGGRPVERLRIADACLNSKSCPHRS